MGLVLGRFLDVVEVVGKNKTIKIKIYVVVFLVDNGGGARTETMLVA